MTYKEVRASLVNNARKMKKTLKNIYKDLMKNGWTLKEIDEMDIHFFFELNRSETVYIDEIKLF